MKKIRKRKKKKIERNHRDPSPIQFLTTPNHASLSVHEKLFNWTFFPLFLPPTYEWPRPTVLKNWWVFFGELQYYIICYMWPYGLANLLFMLLWWAFTGSDIIWPEFLASTPATLRRSPVKVKPGIRGAKSLARLAPAEKWLVKWPTLLYFVHRESPHIHTFTHKSHTKTPHRAMSHFTSTYPTI